MTISEVRATLAEAKQWLNDNRVTAAIDRTELGRAADVVSEVDDALAALDLQQVRATLAEAKQWLDDRRDAETVDLGELGRAADVVNQTDDALAALEDDAAPVAPEAFGGTYAGHGQAKDVYPGGPRGPHHGFEIRAPRPGEVRAFQMGPTPLVGADADPEHARLAADLRGDGWICQAPAPDEGGLVGADLIVGAQFIHVAVYFPDQPLQLANGQMIRAAWFGHVRQDVRAGRVEPGDVIAVSWDSGIRFENNGIQARAAHVHACGDPNGQLSPNGTVDGNLIWEAMTGVRPHEFDAPGPEQYMSGQWIAGRRAQEWQGHPIPPIPA
jgi:hypothetical protein